MELFKFLRIFLYVIKSYFGSFFNNKIIEKDNLTNKNALLLTPFRREEKLDLILKNINMGIVHLNNDYQKKIHGIFFLRYGLRYYEHINKIRSQKIRIFFYKIFILNLLKYLKKKYKIKFVINFAIHYKSEFLFDELSTKLNLKFLTFHRECLYASENTQEFIKSKLQNAPKFKGHKIIVHNFIAKKIFCESKFCEEEKIEIIGPLRIDDNLKFSQKSMIEKKNKTILFYIFGTGSMMMKDEDYGSDWVSNNGWSNLLNNTYSGIISTAKNFHDCEFIFKAKYNSRNYSDYHKKKIINFNGKNISYLSSENNYSLLLKSDLIISFNSTTIIEAALFNKNILIPCFDEAQNKDYSKFIGFKELHKSKVICNSKDDFQKKLSNFIQNKDDFLLNDIDKSILFKNYISEVDGKNEQRVKELFLKEI